MINFRTKNSFIVFVLFIGLSSCENNSSTYIKPNDNNKTNICVFSIIDDGILTSNNWNSLNNSIGFLKSSYVFNMFIGPDYYKDDSKNIYHELIAFHFPSDSIGLFNSIDNMISISYYDLDGNLYMVFHDDIDTYCSVFIDHWSSEYVHCKFNAKMYSYDSKKHIDISGEIFSFNSIK